MARGFEDRLGDIGHHADLIARIVGDLASADLESIDDLGTAAVLWSFVVIGEAVKALPVDLRGRHPEVDWNGFARLRDVLTHQYFRVDAVELRAALRSDLPPLRAAVDEELKRITPDG